MLQTDPRYTFTKEIDVLFWKTLAVEMYQFLRDFASKMFSLFCTTYICEYNFFKYESYQIKEHKSLYR